NFEPAKDNTGLAVFLGERILPATRAGPGTEKATGIRTDHFAGEQPDIELVDAWLGRDIEIAELAQESRRDFGGDRDRLIAAAARNVVEIGDVPSVALAGTDPDRVSVEA